SLAIAKLRIIIRKIILLGINLMKVINVSKVILALALIAIPIYSQTSKEFEQKYNPPAFTYYNIRPNIDLMVFIGKNGKICKMIIEPNSLLESDEKQIPLIYIDDIINEFVPIDQRGNLIMNTISRSGPLGIAVFDYDNVCIAKSVLV